MSADDRGPDEIERRLAELNKEIDKQREREQKTRNRQARKQRPRRPRAQWILSALVAVAIVGGSVYYTLGHRSGSLTPDTSRTTPRLSGPPADPFAGSPANDWADGASGIQTPVAETDGPFTTSQVSSAYTTTRDLLIAQNLNWPTLRGGFPSAFDQLLPSWYRGQFTADIDKTGLTKDGVPRSSRSEVTAFAPGTTQFVTQVVKAHGTMNAAVTTDSGKTVLRVSFDYLFTYAVQPPGKPDNWMRVHPEFPQGPEPSTQPSGPTQNAYSFATPGANAGNTCNPTNGT